VRSIPVLVTRYVCPDSLIYLRSGRTLFGSLHTPFGGVLLRLLRCWVWLPPSGCCCVLTVPTFDCFFPRFRTDLLHIWWVGCDLRACGCPLHLTRLLRWDAFTPPHLQLHYWFGIFGSFTFTGSSVLQF